MKKEFEVFLIGGIIGAFVALFLTVNVLNYFGLLTASAGRSYYNCISDGGTPDHCRDKYLLWMLEKPTPGATE